MKIQSISIVAPTKGCVNDCKFCVSKMHESPYRDNFDEISYRKRIKYAALNGVNTLILTGTGEVLQNKTFLEKLGSILDKEKHPFPNVEIQTTGVFLSEYVDNIEAEDGSLVKYYQNLGLLRYLGVNTISLSVSDIFDSKNNLEIIGVPKKLQFDLDELCKLIKDEGFNLRISLNMLNNLDDKLPIEIFNRLKELGADQVTFREMYFDSNDESEESKYAQTHGIVAYSSKNGLEYGRIALENYIKDNGEKGYRLPFGAYVYSLNGMSVVLDADCMGKESEDDESLKYVILRENGKLYYRWDDEGSLIF